MRSGKIIYYIGLLAIISNLLALSACTSDIFEAKGLCTYTGGCAEDGEEGEETPASPSSGQKTIE
ncbi:MAG: hypothetical protein WCL30_01985 [Pseudomonadota bacterium]